MVWSFVADLNGDPNRKIAILRDKAAQRGIRFTGDSSSGEFSGIGLTGRYVVRGMKVEVTIYSLPFLYSFERARAQIVGFLQE
jgi:hypothetical protein